MISLEKFIENTKGTKVGVPWNDKLTGECVSLIQQYIGQCLNQPMEPRGNAKDWIESYVNEGLGTIVSEPQKGDLLVFPYLGGGYGHISIYIDNKMYDQNNFTHDNLCAGFSKIFTGFKVLRPNSKLIEDTPKNVLSNNEKIEYLNLSDLIDSWRIYPIDKPAIKGNECAFLKPSKFHGLTYKILGYESSNVVFIETIQFGRVKIYIGNDVSQFFSITPNRLFEVGN